MAYDLQICNDDVAIQITCPIHSKRVSEAVSNTCKDISLKNEIKTFFRSKEADTHILLENVDYGCKVENVTALFFENTEYPLLVRSKGTKTVSNLKFYIVGHEGDVIDSHGEFLFGSLNFRNQVGMTDLRLDYDVDGQSRSVSVSTEVLSYKMDYRTDMKQMIREIEQEFSMLSYSFLKQTYLTFKEKSGKSTDLIWWQIFYQCHKDILQSADQIINSPRRRLKSRTSYERAERLPFIGPELENEYYEFQDDPAHLYRTEEMYLSKDTIENRFLKYVLNEVYHRFCSIRRNIKMTLRVADKSIASNLDDIDSRLTRAIKHPFFKGIGQFRGFAQDSLVMKKAHGYSTIYRLWILLACGYELENGLHHLEVKDISELYEIWCFIKVKNIVNEILGDDAKAYVGGKQITGDFIKQLAYGSQSEVTFCKHEGVELASVMYNAQTEREDDNFEGEAESAIKDTKTYTTVQRPDIVLRLTKEGDDVLYTYLFDAKYRLADKKIKGLDVPPVGAINQMHRYRDAIYYKTKEDSDEDKKKEVVGGYVLYPGNMTGDQLRDSYYYESIKQVNIGAYPLRPQEAQIDKEGNLVIDPDSSEAVLREQIEKWLMDDNSRQTLLEESVPQKGLEYNVPDVMVLVGYVPRKNQKLFKDKKLYYVRLGDGKGSIHIDPNFENTQWVLLHDSGEDALLFKLKDNKPRIMSRDELQSKGFNAKHADFYMVFQLEDETPNVTFINAKLKNQDEPYFCRFKDVVLELANGIR